MTTANTIVDFQAKQGEPLVISATLRGKDGAVPPLAGLTVKFNLRRQGVNTPIVSRGTVAIVDAPTAAVTYTGTAADTLAASGFVEAEFLTLNGSQVVNYFPDAKGEYLLGYITPAIA